MNSRRVGLVFLISIAVLLGSVNAQTSSSQAVIAPELAEQAALEARIDAIMDQLSVEEKVGQLFLVSFVGQNATPADAIAELILEYKIGGVVLMEVNNNIDNDAEDTPAQVANLTNQLQNRAYEATRHATPDGDFFLPMFISVDHEGDAFPNSRLRSGFTPIPSAMALGATWSPSNVEAVGAIIGQELAAVGINMLLGPVIDVLEKPHPEGSGDINIRAFGGSPFWVGQMGRAYIRGVHQGSGGRVLTVAKHFPGHGASDRLPDDEVATVNKSLDELQQSDLVPFFAVTRSDPADPLGVTDAMMPSHIRYRGFQGDVSQLTRPISLDREGMDAFMALPPLTDWREEGLIVCDSLGVQAVKSYYDPAMESFPAKQIAKDALLAGNDVLPLVSFAPANDLGWFSGQLPTIQATITFFQEEYRSNEILRQRVDHAVQHILRAKLRLYPELTLENVLAVGDMPSNQGDAIVAEVARKALTLLYPHPEDLPRRLPSPPRAGEDILIMGCFEDCLPVVRIRSDVVRNTLLDLYGPDGSDLIGSDQVHVLDFMQLYWLMSDRLDKSGDEEQAQAMIEQIQAADWILLILINYMPDTQPQTGAARLFLRNPSARVKGVTTRFDLRDKNVVALALHAPYYLDATEIGKLSAYYAVYSKAEPTLQAALRALFQEFTPESAPPVSIEGISYDLATALLPDPGQSLTLTLETKAPDIENGDVWQAGDEVRVLTGSILDHNGHPVRDGTRVLFQGNYTDLPISLSPRQVTDTVDGVAWAVFRPIQAGRLAIMASTHGVDAAPVSLLVAPVVPPTEPPPTATVEVEAPTETPTATRVMPEPTATAPPPTETATAPPPTATATATALPPTVTATGVPPTATGSGPTATSTSSTSRQGEDAFPAAPALILLGGLLALGSLAFLWQRSRSGPPAAPIGHVETDAAETGTASADLLALSPALTGRTLGSCRVDRKIGEGGMGQVYKGYHPMLDRSVAIKILPPALVAAKEMRARFLQEARIAASLRHPNIVQIHDFGETDNLMYLTMEYIEGTSLNKILNQLREAGEMMPVVQAVGIAVQIAEALAYAHERDAIHRDLKPANILLNERGQAILVDFGLAVLRGGPRYTGPGKVWGSPTYIAPEQLSDPPQVDARSDIYSLGILLYEMVTGRAPFKGDAVMEVLWQQANVPPRPPHEFAPDLPTELEAIILKALAKLPDERYTTAQEMAEALSALQS